MMTLTRTKNELENCLVPKTWKMRADLLNEANRLVEKYSAIRDHEDDVCVLRDEDYELKAALENLETVIHNIK